MNGNKEIDWERLKRMIQERKGERWALIPLLQDIQEVFNYIPPEAIDIIARELNLFPSEVQGVITFYAGFSMEPKGKYVLKVCRGTACHVKGGKSILRLVKKELNLDEGETGQDYQFTLETTACLGACALAPTMMINKSYFGRLTPPKLINILSEYSGEKKK
jgi:NADH:ubiquinone oxidoreductase subunit E